jgi:uncharacterized protein YbjT (DUF2867 family)
MENLLRQAQAIKEQGTFSMANTAGRPLPAVATRDVAAAAAALLLDTSWSGQAGAQRDHDSRDKCSATRSSQALALLSYT